MSRIFDALRQFELEEQGKAATADASANAVVPQIPPVPPPPPVEPTSSTSGDFGPAVEATPSPQSSMPPWEREAVRTGESTSRKVSEEPVVEVAAPDLSWDDAPSAVPELNVPDFRNASVRGPFDMGGNAHTSAGTATARTRVMAEIPDALVSVRPTIDLQSLEQITAAPMTPGYLVSMTDERGLGAEKFRVLAARLCNLRRESKLQVVQVTSSIIGEGKTLVSANLAVTLAKRTGESAVLVEGDLRKPAACRLFGVGPLTGIGNWWRENSSSVQPYLRRINDMNLCLLPAGFTAHSAAVLQSGRMAEMIEELRGWFDWVVVDTPPLLPMADSNLWARLVDGTLLVVRENVVPRRALQSAVESMDQPKLLGIVLNDATDFESVGYYDYYGSYYSHGAPPEETTKKKSKRRKKK